MDQNMTMPSGKCSCPHHKVVPVLVVLFGLTFLLGEFDILMPGTVSLIWPILVIAGGLMKLFSHRCRCCMK